MRPNWLHRASQSASEGPVVYIRSRGEFHEAAACAGSSSSIFKSGQLDIWGDKLSAQILFRKDRWIIKGCHYVIKETLTIHVASP